MSHTYFQRLKKSIKARFCNQETLAALIFLIGLIIFEAVVFRVAFRHYFGSLRRGEYLIGFGALMIVFASWAWAALFFRAALMSGYATRIVYYLIFVLAVGFEYGYQKAFSRFSTVEDLRIALFDTTTQQSLDGLRAYGNWWVIVPWVAFAVLLITIRSNRRKSWGTLALLLAGLVAFYSAIGPFISGHFTTISLNAFMRTVITSPWKWAAGYRGPRESVAPHPDHRPQNNIILIIDESVRGDHLGINNYNRATTPYLEKLAQQHLLYNWGIAAAGTTCSFSADTLLFTGINPMELPDTGFQIRKVPNIFQYARAMGYRTHFLDGQRSNFWIGTSADQTYIDDWQPVTAFDSADWYNRDAMLAKKIKEIVTNATGQFIWVNKLGVHYPYRRAFPPTATEWQPIDQTDRPDPARKLEMINTYDDAVKYNLENFFQNLGIEEWQNRNILIYTSDHGQTLSEHGEQHTHCGTTADTFPTEANVPLFMITREPLAVDTAYRASHGNIFATLLDFMDFPAGERRHAYPLSLMKAKAGDSQTRYFWVGDPNERVLGARLKFDP